MVLLRPTFTFTGRAVAVDLPHLAFASAIAGWCAWFCRDAWLAQARVENLILILPASLAAMILYVVIAAGCFHIGDREAASATLPARKLAPGLGVKIAGTMALLGGYVVAAPLIGFDVMSFAFILATLWLLGERRILVLLLLPAAFCALVIYCFDTVLQTPLPLLLFAGDTS